MLVGAIEGGGTKFICAVASIDSPGAKPRMLKQVRIPTDRPETTLGACIDFFRDFGLGEGTTGAKRQESKKYKESPKGGTVRSKSAIQALGIGMFGPVECDTESTHWGYALNTPKPGWVDINVAQKLRSALGVPIRLETDVGAAAIGEWMWGAGKGSKTCVYATVGTGIGAGILIDGKPLRSSYHPEVGHMRIPRVPGDNYGGICLHHRDCLEGLASGPAMQARWGVSPENLPADHPAWKLEAQYLAQAFANIVLTVAPDKIVVGGGIGLHKGLVEIVDEQVRALLGGYIRAFDAHRAEGLSDETEHRIVRAALGAEAGILGAAYLGWKAASSSDFA